MFKKILLILFLSAGISMGAKIENESVTFSNTVNVASNMMVSGATVLNGVTTFSNNVAIVSPKILMVGTNVTGSYGDIQMVGETPTINLLGSKTANGYIGSIRFANGANDSLVELDARRSGANDAGALVIFTQPSGGTLTERVRVEPDGDVGIGKEPASARLHVEGDVIITTNLTVGGVISGNGSGLTNVEQQTLQSMSVFGGNGAVLSQNYLPGYSVAFSDTDATFVMGCFVPKAGNYRIGMLWQSDTANTAKTMSGKVYIGQASSAGGSMSWNLASGANWDLALPSTPAPIMEESVYGTIAVSADRSFIGMLYIKDDNAGGASGNLFVHGMTLTRTP